MKKPRQTPLYQLKKQLHKSNLRAVKSLGQHFLVDESVLERIVAAAELAPEDVVIEVGPGLGVLTRELAKRVGRVIAVELDHRLAGVLKRELASFTNVTILFGDILELTPLEMLRIHGSGAVGYKVVANLPYYITSPVLRHFLEASVKPDLMVVMVQEEVGEAIVATSGKMSLLSVSVHFYARPNIITRVPSSSFEPPPKVDSVVLRLDVLPEPAVKVTDISGFFNLVRRGFGSRRKQLLNALALGLHIETEKAHCLLDKAGIETRRRAETLRLEEWARLFEALRVGEC